MAAASIGLLIALALQLRAARYVAWIYWLAIVMVAVFGTMVADVLHVVIGIPYIVSTASLGLALAVIFAAWYRVEGTLSIHHIDTHRRELFYWATVMATFALGTAAGDLTAATLGLGYPGSTLLFGLLFVLPAVAYRLLGWNPVLCFWTAYVITRPLGASVADWLGKSTLGGLGLGDAKVAAGLTVLIVLCVGYLTVTRRDVAGRRSDESVQGRTRPSASFRPRLSRCPRPLRHPPWFDGSCRARAWAPCRSCRA